MQSTPPFLSPWITETTSQTAPALFDNHMDCTGFSDQELVDAYAELAEHSDPSSDTFPFDDAGSLANELEERGFVESAGVWSHPDKPELVASTV